MAKRRSTERIVKWWAKFALAGDVALLAVACLSLAARFEAGDRAGSIATLLTLANPNIAIRDRSKIAVPKRLKPDGSAAPQRDGLGL